MDNRIAFDVYAVLKDPHFRVDFEADADRVEVVFGGPSVCDEPANVLNLWLTNPLTAVDLGRELIKCGHQFLVSREDAAADSAAAGAAGEGGHDG